MEKFPFLIAMQGIIGGVNVKDNLARNFAAHFEKNIDRKIIDR